MSKQLPPAWCELVCHNCARTESGRWVRGRVPLAAMLKEAGASWRVHDGDYFCRARCVDEHEERKQIAASQAAKTETKK